MKRQLALLALFALLCFSNPQTTARHYWVGRETGVFGLGFIYSGDPVLFTSLAAEFPYNTTAHAWFARIHNDTVTGKLVEARFEPYTCTLTNPEEMEGNIALFFPRLHEPSRACADFQEPTAAMLAIERAGGKGIIVGDSFLDGVTNSPRDAMWRQVDETEMVAVLVDTLIAERLLERKLVYQSLNMTLNVTINAMSPEVQHAAGEYQASVRALTFGLPILSGVVIIVAIICFIIRLRDGMRGISKIETLARLALLFIVCACVLRIAYFGADYRGAQGIVAKGINSTINAFSIGFDASAVLFVLTMWLLVVSWTNSVFTSLRSYRASLISSMIVMVVLLALGAAQQSLVSAFVVLVLLLLIVVGYVIIGTMFLRQLYQMFHFASKKRMTDSSSLKLRSVLVRMTVLLFGVAALAITIFCLYVTDLVLPKWSAGHIFSTWFTEICRLIIESLIVVALLVSPKRSYRFVLRA